MRTNTVSEPGLSLLPCLNCLCNLSCSIVSWIYQELFLIVPDLSFSVAEGNVSSFNMFFNMLIVLFISWASLLSEKAGAACLS